MNLGYRGRKRLSRLADRKADQAFDRLVDQEGEAIATIASNAVHDSIQTDDQLSELIAIATASEELAEDVDVTINVANNIEDAWFGAENAVTARSEQIVDDAIESVVSREVIA